MLRMTKINKEDANICIDCDVRLVEIENTGAFSANELELLDRPQRVFTFAIPVRMDNGSVQIFNGYRVQYNDALGPTKGGIRYHPHVDLEEVKTLAFLMALKTSLLQIPFGGAKGGIEVDPSKLSEGELERLTRGFVRAAHRLIGSRTDIPAPDVNTNAQVMAWFVDEYAKVTGHFEPGVVTGKPLELGGSEGREKATALGGAFALEHYRKSSLNKESKDLTVAIQGFGNVGGHIAQILSDWGYKVVAVSDAYCAVYNKDGLDIESLKNYKKDNNQCGGFTGGEEIKGEDLLTLDVDILIPAALANQITKDNAGDIKASVILEMANAPVTKEADEILEKSNVTVLPDILANAGGVVVSYFEWVQNSSNDYWKEEEVNKKLEEKMLEACDEVSKKVSETGKTARVASYELAIERILGAEKLRGNL